MNIDKHFTPAQLAEGRRNAASALVHKLNGDTDAAFRTLTTATSFAATLHGLIDITAGALPKSDETRATLQRIAAGNEGIRDAFTELEEGPDDE